MTLERQAYARIAEEEERLRILNNAKSEDNRQKCAQKYAMAKASCDLKISQYQHVSDLVDLLLPALYFLIRRQAGIAKRFKLKVRCWR